MRRLWLVGLLLMLLWGNAWADTITHYEVEFVLQHDSPDVKVNMTLTYLMGPNETRKDGFKFIGNGNGR